LRKNDEALFTAVKAFPGSHPAYGAAGLAGPTPSPGHAHPAGYCPGVDAVGHRLADQAAVRFAGPGITVRRRPPGSPHRPHPGSPGVGGSVEDVPEFEQQRHLKFHNELGERVWDIPKGRFFVKGEVTGVDSVIWGPLPFRSFLGLVLVKLPPRRT
jgi:hypothetical protein